eukprot:SAG22_NODE_1543_length_4162_cov_1.982279_3_plen_306_part_00
MLSRCRLEVALDDSSTQEDEEEDEEDEEEDEEEEEDDDEEAEEEEEEEEEEELPVSGAADDEAESSLGASPESSLGESSLGHEPSLPSRSPQPGSDRAAAGGGGGSSGGSSSSQSSTSLLDATTSFHPGSLHASPTARTVTVDHGDQILQRDGGGGDLSQGFGWELLRQIFSDYSTVSGPPGGVLSLNGAELEVGATGGGPVRTEVMAFNRWLATGVGQGVVEGPAVAALGEAGVDGAAAGAIWEDCATADSTLELEAGSFAQALASLAAQRFPHEPTAAAACERLAEEHIEPMVAAVNAYRSTG